MKNRVRTSSTLNSCSIVQINSLDKLETIENSYELSLKNLVYPTQPTIPIIDIGRIRTVQKSNAWIRDPLLLTQLKTEGIWRDGLRLLSAWLSAPGRAK